MDPLSAGVFASISSAFKFAEVAVRIAEVGNENAVFVRAICVVRSDLEEVERLLSLEAVQKKLTSTPGKLPWIKIAIQNTRCALNEIGKWVERARVEHEATGSIKLDTRVRWVFNDHEKLLNRKTELSTCHQQLSNVLGYLTCLEGVPANPVSLGYESTTYFEDILARHGETSARQVPKAKLEKRMNTQQEGWVSAAAIEQTSAALTRPAPVPRTRNPPNAKTTVPFYRNTSEPTSSWRLPILPPDSPPPTYTATVSSGPVLHSTCSDQHPYISTNLSAAVYQSADRKATSIPENDSYSAYRIGPGDMEISELAGDTVSFSATNSAGPVNPYEFCANLTENNRAADYVRQAPSEVLAEMLGDLHFPLELPSNNEPASPHDCTPWSRTRFEHVGMNQSMRTQSRRRITAETSSVVHRRPVPMGTLNDSIPMVHELPSSLELDAANRATRKIESTPNPSSFGSFAVNMPLQNTHWPRPYDVPFAYTACGPNSEAASGSVSIAHYSKPPPMQPVYSQQAVAFSANSTSSWGLDTQPKRPKAPTALEPVTATRMQSQKQILDLLDTIET